MLKHLKELAALPGIAGQETAVREYIEKVLAQSGATYTAKVDPLGNLLVWLKGEAEAPKTVMFEAHMDEVGMMVTGITDAGYLRFATAGGIDEKVLVGRRVTVNGHTGVIGCGAIHLCPKDEKSKPVSADRLMIDIGAENKEEAEAVVAIGDAVIFDSEFTDLFGGKFKARDLDDRVGCALLLSLLEKPFPYDVLLAFTVQE
ncbi:MAG: M42 family peptidase, partial [Clostridia bacterium]|nr:M42 family peptidase [Clostridia bacterium]